MNHIDDCNYEIAVLQRNIRDLYRASDEAASRADFVASANMLESAAALQEELRDALAYREQALLTDEDDCPCSDCDCPEDDQDFCEFRCNWENCDCAFNGTQVTLQISEDLDQSYQLDVLLNELNVMGGQIEYQQDEIDYLQEELKDAEDAIDYWVGEADRNSNAQSDYDDLVCLFQAQQRDYHDLEKTLFSERAAYEKANDLLHDDIIDLQYQISKLTKRLNDTSERAADYWKRLKSAEAES